MRSCTKCKYALNVDEINNICFKCRREVVEDDSKFGKLNKSSTGSKRFNEGKPEVSQLDPRFIMALADMMTRSAKKYGKYNWALGQEYHTPYDSCQRHLLKWIGGEDCDDESGMSHLLHAAANIMIMWTSQQKGNKELDTRHDWE